MSASQPPLAGRRVLLVDEHGPSARLMSVVLAAAGADVRAVADGRHALAEATAFEPDLVVIDPVLARVDALEVIRALQTQGRPGARVLVAVSAVNGAALGRAVREAGCADYLLKPIDVDTFAERLATQLKGRP